MASNECEGKIENHHILGGAYGREDHVSNIVRLCTHHHELITDNDFDTRAALGFHVETERQDVLLYVRDRLGTVSGDEWLRRRLFIDS